MILESMVSELYAVLVRNTHSWTGAATMENSMACPHKTKNRVAIWSSKYTPEHISGQNYNSKKKCPAIFIAELFPIAKT